MIQRTVLEWRSLPYGFGEGQIPVALAEQLERVARGSSLGGRDGSQVLSLGHRAITARQVVGVLVADGVVLEILPKIDGLGGDDAEGHGQIRKRLVHMLAVALDIKVEVGAKTKLNWQRETLLEVLIGLFTRKLADQVRKGMPRRYLEHEDDLAALRGRLNVTRQFTKLIAQPDRLACRYDDLSSDIALNQIMKAAVHRLMRLSRSSENQRLLRELAFTYADIKSVEPSALAWNSLVLDRTNSRWRELVDLARLLMGGRYQTTSAGKVDGFSLMFDMSRLFEAYITQQLRRVVRGTGLTVHAQGGRLFCLQETDTGKQRFMTKPDILIRRGAKVEVIIDTKWKRISRRIDDAKQSVNQGDVYQMIAYGHLYNCPRMVLLYPHHTDLAAEAGLQNRHGITGTAHVLSTETVDLSGDALSQLTISLERMLAASTSTPIERSIDAENA